MFDLVYWIYHMICMNAVTAIRFHLRRMQWHDLDRSESTVKRVCENIYLTDSQYGQFFEETSNENLGAFLFPEAQNTSEAFFHFSQHLRARSQDFHDCLVGVSNVVDHPCPHAEPREIPPQPYIAQPDENG
jgi:hypothetical protein